MRKLRPRATRLQATEPACPKRRARLQRLARADTPTKSFAVYALARRKLARGSFREAAGLLQWTEFREGRELCGDLGETLQVTGDCCSRLSLFGRSARETGRKHLSPPNCPRSGLAYELIQKDGWFALCCGNGHGLNGYPRWLPGLGTLADPAEVPPEPPLLLRPVWSPVEALARRLAFGRPSGRAWAEWLSACRRNSGDDEGALQALKPVPGDREPRSGG